MGKPWFIFITSGVSPNNSIVQSQHATHMQSFQLTLWLVHQWQSHRNCSLSPTLSFRFSYLEVLALFIV